MKKLIISLFIILIISCEKNNSPDAFTVATSLTGVWVEKTLRLDTMEFNSLLASSHQSVYYKSQQNFKGYTYRLNTDSILLQSFDFSSGSVSCYFNFNNLKQFVISKFFQRSSLPATVQFQKIN